MRRREFFALPVAALAGGVREGAPRVAVVWLGSARPFEELGREWAARGLAEPVRIVARAEPGWWPSRTELPGRWRAWLELADGSAVVVVREAGPLAEPETVRGGVARVLVEALSLGGWGGTGLPPSPLTGLRRPGAACPTLSAGEGAVLSAGGCGGV